MSLSMAERAKSITVPSIPDDDDEADECSPQEQSERSRLKTRAAMKKQLAAAEVLAQEIQETTQGIAQAQAEADSAADGHSEKADGIQRELADIREQQIALRAKGKPLSEKVEARRDELLAALDDENQRLSATCKSARERAHKLSRRYNELVLQMKEGAVVQVLRNKLVRDVGNPRWKLELFAAEQKCEWLYARLNRANEMLKNAEAGREKMQRNRQPTEVAIYQARIDRWHAEIEAAGRELEEARREATELRQKIEQE
jgi:hypothetical protein